MKDIKDFIANQNTHNCIDLIEVSEKLGYKSTTTANRLVKNNQFPNAFKVGKKIWIPITDFERIQWKFQKKESVKKAIKPAPEPIQIPFKFKINTHGYIDVSETEKVFKLSKKKVINIINKGGFINYFKHNNKWLILKVEIENLKKEIQENEKKKFNTLSTMETAHRINVNRSVITQNLKNKFPNAFKIDNYWRIPLRDIEKYEEKTVFTDASEYTIQTALAELNTGLNSLYVKEKSRETNRLYLKFCTLQMNNCKGSMRYVKSRVLMYLRLYEKIASLIEEEIFHASPDMISSLLDKNSILTSHEKKNLTVFLRYTYRQKNIEPKEEFSYLTNTDKISSKEIYSPELFHEIYKYVNDIKNHSSPAIKDYSYANMWAYTILLLTDFIRGQDLIVNTPNLDLDNLGICSLNWFEENELSEEQAQTIINQLYTHFRYKRANKNGELLSKRQKMNTLFHIKENAPKNRLKILRGIFYFFDWI
ncbi:helix-turn-helix domain-containing protein [Sporosarcina ureae]|uniref:helix-turn-helix domain-containing protein n=1 Tax=Sporosarcina ureae TaxID=1571 RepID=UPI000A17EA69|nr:helix-turn-helix domain-containing protein [Sporosarcina ureae]ARK21858.1 hypothetical protein SporoP32a_10185 [Sporosarcina ureae]